MNTNNTKRILMLLVCICILTTAAVAAGNVRKNITVDYPGISLEINGERVVPKDANGNVVEPFIYNGTTYLPIRAIGEAMGATVAWDNDSKTASLSTLPPAVKPYDIKNGTVYDVSDGKNFSVMGKSYTQGFVLDGKSISNPCYALINCDGYTELSFDVGHIDNSGTALLDLIIYLDDAEYERYDITATQGVEHITIELDGASVVKLEFAGEAGYFSGDYGFFNLSLN
ncbi:MAG: stalk domain-containing protein [Candidatus Heteroscillospira sp.]|jgi:hypothetical protein